MAAVVGFVWLTVAIARGKTLYPRWVAFANPLVCMGIGLSVSRSIIERHHGRPWAEPNDGGPGATFSFWIPRQGQSLEAAPVASTS